MSRKSKIRCGGLIFRRLAGFMFIALAIALPSMSVDFTQEPSRLGSDQVTTIAFSPDGTILAAWHDADGDWRTNDGELRLWDVETQKQVGALKKDLGWINSIAFSPDGKLLAFGCIDYTIRLWDVAGQNQVGMMQPPSPRRAVHSVAFSPDGKTLASSGANYSGENVVRLWDVQTQQQVGELKGHTQGDVYSVAFSPDGRLLFSGGGRGDEAIRVWDVQTEKQVGELIGHLDDTHDLAFSPDRTILASAGGWDDKAVYLWDFQAQTRVGVLGGHSAHIGSVAFSPDGKLLVSTVFWDDTVHFWDVKGQKHVGVLKGHDASDMGWFDQVAFSPDGKWLACGSENGVELWELNLPGPISRAYAYGPQPFDGTLHTDTWVNLDWGAGDLAVSHDVYLGENFDDVNAGAEGTFVGNQAVTSLIVGLPGFAIPDGLVPGTTYYWRIDEVNETEPNSPWKGPVWSFTILPTKAHDPKPSDGVKFVDPYVEFNWTAGLGAGLHTVYFGENYDDVNNATGGLHQGVTTYIPGPLKLAKTYYWRVDELTGGRGGKTHKGEVWSFRTLPDIPITDPNLTCWWKLDEGIGTTAVDWSGHGNHGTLEGDPQWVAGYDGDALEFGGNGDYVELPTGIIGSDKGSISMWIKTIQAVRGMIFYGSDGTSGDGYGGDNELHVNVENGGVAEFLIEGGDSDVSIESSALNDDSWHHIVATWDINGQANLYVDGGAPISVDHTGNDFNLSGLIRLGRPNASTRYYAGLLDDVRVFDYVLSPDDIAITMRGDVKLAWGPKPVNEAILNKREVSSLGWSPGDNASQHDVYLGTDRDAVADADASDTTGTYRGRQGAASYTPPEGIQWGQSHYWRIDEYNTDATITKGRLWSFSILDFILVEDFEDYNDFPPDEIFNTWLDGYGTTTNGSTAGYPEPDFLAGEHYVETTIVHGGDQSMPYFYDNNFKYSEATMTLSYPRDWTEEGVGVLSLWFQGRPGSVGSFTEGPAGTYTMTASGADIWDEADEFHFAYKTLTGPGTIIAKVESVENTHTWAKCGVMIRETLDAGSKFAAVYITPTKADGTAENGCRFQGRKDTDGSAESDTSVATAEQMAITAPYWVKLERDVAGNFRASYSSNGVTWQSMVWRQSITMSSNVYVGLALTSHDNNATGEAKFSDVQITGTVTGQWQSQDIGIPSNAAEPMYVALNGSASVYHDDPSAALIDTWTQWPIDLQEFAAQGVNLANVNTISIGFGDKNNLQAGGSGMVFFDDIRLYRPAP